MQKGRRRWRTWLHAGHKWAGLSLGALFVLLGLTGSLLVFYQELDDGFRDSGSAPVLAVSPDRIVAALRAAEPERVLSKVQPPPPASGPPPLETPLEATVHPPAYRLRFAA